MKEDGETQSALSQNELGVDGLKQVGRFTVFDGFETGVLLSCDLDDGGAVEITLSPAEALTFGKLIEANRATLEDAVVRGIDETVSSEAAAYVRGKDDGPMPIPTVQHLKPNAS